LAFVDLFFLCGFAAVETNLPLGVSGLRRVTFLLPEKSPKGHLRGFPLDIPFLKIRRAFFCFRHEGIEWANQRPRSPAPAVEKSVASFSSECLALGWNSPPHTFDNLREPKWQTDLAMYGGEGRQAKLDAKDLGGRNN